MKRIRLRTIVIFSLAVLSGALLLYTSQNVQQAEHQLRQIQSSIAQEEEAIRVLNAEWAYLNSPERLEELAAEYLRLAPAAPGQIVPESSALPDAAVPAEGEKLLRNVSQQAQPASDQKESTP